MEDGPINVSALAPGTRLNNGNYTIVEKIGEGGFGITYRALQNNLNRTVCIKEYFLAGRCLRHTQTNHITFTGTSGEFYEKYRQAFVREAETVASLSHPSIVEVISIFSENNTSYMVMPFIEGRSLETLVRQRGPLPFAETMNYMAQIAEAVEYIHNRHILHRDIKPSNIMITEDYRAILIDFGSAREFIDDKTQAHTSILTKGYAPPEQYSTVSRKGAYSDIYSLGATLYYALTGCDPVDSAARMTEALPEPRQMNADIPQHVNTTILRAMQLNPQERYQNVREYMQDLNQEEAPEEPIPDEEAAPIPAYIPSNSRKVWYVVVPVLVVFFAVAIILGTRHLSPAQSKDCSLPTELYGLQFYGSIGNDNNASLEIFRGSVVKRGSVVINGQYHFVDAFRDVSIYEFYPETGHLVLYAYWHNDNKYLGKFDGFIECEKDGFRYSGTFTNHKEIAIPFSMHAQGDKATQYSENKTEQKEQITSTAAVSDKVAAVGVNAYIYDDDGDYTNIRSSPIGAVVDRLPCEMGRYGLNVDRQVNGWWHINEARVYDAQTDQIIQLTSSDCWIHGSRIKFAEDIR